MKLKFLEKLPTPFCSERDSIYSQKAEVLSSDMTKEQRFSELERLTGEIRFVEKVAISAMGGEEAVKEHYWQVTNNLRFRKEMLGKSQEVGIEPSVAETGPNSSLISEVVYAKNQVERLCSESIDRITPLKEFRLGQVFRQFVTASNQLDGVSSNSTLTAEIERVRDLFVQRKQDINCYKNQLEGCAPFSSQSHYYRPASGGDKQPLVGQERDTYATRHVIPDLQDGPPSAQEQQSVEPDLENVKVNFQASCRVRRSCGPVEVGLGPVISLEKGGNASIGLALNVDLNPLTTNQKHGVDCSISASKGPVEVGVESSISSAAIEYGYKAQINGCGDLNGGLRVRSKSFKQLFRPATIIDNGQLFAGHTLKRGRLGTNVRFGVLPVEKLKDIRGSDLIDVDANRFDSGSLCFEKQNRIGCQDQDLELVLKQGGLQVAFPLAEVQQESTEQKDLDIDKKEVSTFVEKRTSKQASQVAMSTPPPPQPYSVSTTTNIEQFLIMVMLVAAFFAYIWELFCKFKNRNKDL